MFYYLAASISGTLGQLLTSQSLPMTSRLSLFEQMLEGLAFLHAEGCMHRDIKGLWSGQRNASLGSQVANPIRASRPEMSNIQSSNGTASAEAWKTRA
jgi:serine/threonine protein kinase